MSALCRDCLLEVAAASARCPGCGSPRLIAHAELAELSIAHLDCDAFYAAIEKRDDPSLQDKPVIVGGGRRGVASTACYVARLYGVRSAMPMFKALKLCPQAVVIRPNMAKYQKVGREVAELMEATTPLVESLSIDEAFLDLGGTAALHHGSPARTLAKLALEIERRLGITVSVGLSYNKFLAKVASDLDKPRGFAVIGRADATGFLRERPVSLIWGVGRSLQERLRQDGIARIGQLQQMEEAALVARYGSMGRRLYHFSRGEDGRSVDPEAPAKSVSAETTFEADMGDFAALSHELWPLCERVARRLKRSRLAGRTITLKLKTAAFRIVTRSQTLPDPTQLAERIYQSAQPLLKREADGRLFRLIGVGASELADAVEADPLDLADPASSRRKRVEQAIDRVREKLGQTAIGKGRGFTAEPKPPARRS